MKRKIKNMNMKTVESPNIAEIGYDISNQTMRVKFRNGQIFEQAGMSKNTYHSIRPILLKWPNS